MVRGFGRFAVSGGGGQGAHDAEGHGVAGFQRALGFAEIIERCHRLAVDADDHVLLLDADFGGEGVFLDSGDGDAELGGGTFDFGGDFDLIAVTGEAFVILENFDAVLDEYGQVELLSATVDGDFDVRVDRGFGDDGDQFIAVLDALAVDGDDDVLGAEAGLFGGAFGDTGGLANFGLFVLVPGDADGAATIWMAGRAKPTRWWPLELPGFVAKTSKLGVLVDLSAGIHG